MSGELNIIKGLVAWAHADATYRESLSVPGATFPLQAPQGVKLPYVVFDVIDDPKHYQLDGVTGIRNPLVQLEAWAGTVLEVIELADRIEADFELLKDGGDLGGIDVRGVFQRRRSLNREERGDGSDASRYSVQLDFEIWRAT